MTLIMHTFHDRWFEHFTFRKTFKATFDTNESFELDSFIKCEFFPPLGLEALAKPVAQ